MWDKANPMLVDAGTGGGSWHWGHGGWDGAMGFHGLVWILFLALVAFAVVLLVRAAARGGAPVLAGADGRSTVAVLDARYARGEIDRDEHLERKRDLS